MSKLVEIEHVSQCPYRVGKTMCCFNLNEFDSCFSDDYSTVFPKNCPLKDV